MRGVLAAVLGDVGGHLPLGALVALALGVTAVLAFSAAVARAEVPKLIPDGQFESEGALGVAVDQSTSGSDPSHGDVYVAGFFTLLIKSGAFEFVPGRVNKFDAVGGLLKPPSPVGEAAFGYSGAAVNPVNGEVYALDAQNSEIDTYDPTTGELRSSFPVEPSSNFSFFISWTVVGIAADSAGNVYVPVVPNSKVCGSPPTSCVLEYSPTGELLKTFTGGTGASALKEPTGVAVDPAGNVWVADHGNERIEELSPTDTPIGEINSEGVQAVAVDAHGDVFATVRNGVDFCGKLKPPCSHLVEYSSTGAQLADLGAGSIGAQTAGAGEGSPLPNMVAVSDSSGRVYVTEGMYTPPEGVQAHSRVFKFAPPVAPKLEGEVAVEVGVSEAKLGAVVNPGGISAAYRFEYGTTAAYGHAVPFPEGDTGGGFHSRNVWASASGLLPGTTYHYRVVVTSDLGTLVGVDKTFTTKTAAGAGCPNEQFRTGFSASLPDCRAYELVTPPNKEGAVPDPPSEKGDIEQGFEKNFAAVDGNRMSFKAENVFPGSKGTSAFYVATRGPSGWSSENMYPSTNNYGFECPHGDGMQYSADLSKAIVPVSSGGECDLEPELVSGEPKGAGNLFVRDNTNGSYRLVNVTPADVSPANATLVAASDDFSHVVFAEQAELTPNAVDGVNVYEWSGGVVRLVTVLPSGAGVAGSFAGISRDGSRVFFIAGGNLYARVSGASTVQLDASQAGGGGGGGSFVAASADDSQVVFSDDASAALTGDTTPGSGLNLYAYNLSSGRLTHVDASQAGGSGGGASFISVSADGSQVLFSDDASAGLTGDTVSGSGMNLYKYDSASGRLTDLTPGAPAELQGVFGHGEDLSYVYFEANGSLAAGATQGQPNRYLWHAGTLTFLTSLGEGPLGHLEVSKNGRFLAFASTQSLTGFDSTDVNTGEADFEVYLYDAAANGLECASCNATGAPPAISPRWGSQHNLSPRNLSENGRVFFDTAESLLPADTNSTRDVYEFEPDSVGSCGGVGGCLSLISTGTGSLETWFIEASPSGNDVFLREFQKLVPRDTVEESQTIYDARVDGGIAEPATSPPCTTADACRTAPAPQPLIFGAPASQTFSGAGNLLAPGPTVNPPAKPKPKPKKCRKGYVKKKGKCVKSKAKKGKRARKTNRKGSK